jgi:uncharacterized protein (TIGR02594 family)
MDERQLAVIVTADYLNFRGGVAPAKPVLVLKKGDIIQATGKAWIQVISKDGRTGWLSFEYVEYTDLPAPAPVLTPEDKAKEPPWITWARQQRGVKEVPGAGDNPTIVAWYHLTTLPAEYWHDATAWCAVFVNAGFFLNGVTGTRSARAVDWLNFGVPVSVPQLGDVVVFEWPPDREGKIGHHVAFVLSRSGGLVKVIGGNQSNAVTIASYEEKYVMGYRRAA